MAMNRDPAWSPPTARFAHSKKYCFRILGSSVLPDLLDTMKSVRAGSILLSMVRICAGSVEFEHQQLRAAVLTSEGLGEHLRPETRSAHAEENDVREALLSHIFG